MANKITIDPTTLLSWTTATNYRIAISPNFVREVGNNKSYNLAIPNAATFQSYSSGPYVVSTNYQGLDKTFVSTATIVYNRKLDPIINSNATYQLVSTSSGVIATFGQDQVSFDGDRTVRITLNSVTIPDGKYYISSDAGIWSDNFGFPNIQERILETVTSNPIWTQTTMSNLDILRNYIGTINGNEIRNTRIFSNQPPQIVATDYSSLYTLILESIDNAGTFDGQTTKIITENILNINSAIPLIEYDSLLDGNDDVEYRLTLSKNGITIISRVLPLYGTTFTLSGVGGSLTVSKDPTSPTFRHWYKKIPLFANLNTTTVFDSSDGFTQPITFRVQKYNSTDTNFIISTTTISNNSSSIIATLSTGTYDISAYWLGKTQSPEFESALSTNFVSLISSDRSDYPGTLTLTAPTDIYQLSLNKFTLTGSINTVTNGQVTFYSSGTAITSTNFIQTNTVDIFAYPLNNSYSVYWEGQPEDDFDNVPFHPLWSNTVTQNFITGTIALSINTTSNSILDDTKFTISANTNSVIQNTVQLFNGTSTIAFSSIPENTSSVEIIMPAGSIPLSESYTATVATAWTSDYTATWISKTRLRLTAIGNNVSTGIVGDQIKINGDDRYRILQHIFSDGYPQYSRMEFEFTPEYTGSTSTNATVHFVYQKVIKTFYKPQSFSAKLITANANIMSASTTQTSVAIVPPTSVNANLVLTTPVYQYGDNTNTTALITLTGTYTYPTGQVALIDLVNGNISTSTLVYKNAVQSTATFNWYPPTFYQGTGTHQLYVSYPGDSNNLSTSSNIVSLTVNGPFVSTSTITISPNRYAGYNLDGSDSTKLVTATIIVSSSINHAPTGIVSLSDGVSTLGTGTLTAINTSQSSVNISWIPANFGQIPGIYNIVSSYTGDIWNTISTSSNNLEITKAQPTITLSYTNIAGNTTAGFTYPDQILFTVTQPSGTNLTGPVNISDVYGGSPIAIVYFNGNLTTSTAVISDTLYNTIPYRASYAEDSKFASTVSNVVNFTVVPVTNTLSLIQDYGRYGYALATDDIDVSITATSVSSNLLTPTFAVTVNGSSRGNITLVDGRATKTITGGSLATNALHTVRIFDSGDRNHTAISTSTYISKIQKTNTMPLVHRYVAYGSSTSYFTSGPEAMKSSLISSVILKIRISPLSRIFTLIPPPHEYTLGQYPIGYNVSGNRVYRYYDVYQGKYYGTSTPTGYPSDDPNYSQWLGSYDPTEPYPYFSPAYFWEYHTGLKVSPTGTIKIKHPSGTVITEVPVSSDNNYETGNYPTYDISGQFAIKVSTTNIDITNYVKGLTDQGPMTFTVEYSGDKYYHPSTTTYQQSGTYLFVPNIFDIVSYDPTNPNEPPIA